MEWIEAHRSRGPVLIHCALGHGRTGCIVLCWMVAHGRAPDVGAAIEQLRTLRPGFRVAPEQRACIEQWIAVRGAPA